MTLPTATEAAAVLADQAAMQRWMGDISTIATAAEAGAILRDPAAMARWMGAVDVRTGNEARSIFANKHRMAVWMAGIQVGSSVHTALGRGTVLRVRIDPHEVYPDLAEGQGVAFDATTGTQIFVDADLAFGTGDVPHATVALQHRTFPATAKGTGITFGPRTSSPKLVAATVAAGTGIAYNVTTPYRAPATRATGTGLALAPTVSRASGFTVQLASGSGQTFNATVTARSVFVARIATATGIAPTPTVVVTAPNTVPDRRNAIDPNAVIDPTGNKDSTAGLQNWISQETAANATLFLPFDLRVEGQIVLSGNRTFRSANIASPHRLYKTLTYPYRIVPDTRAALPGTVTPNPAYNPAGRCAKWLYDAQGGKASEPASITNPNWNGTTAGGNKGGYCATDENHLSNWDGLHLKATNSETPWTAADVGRAITVFQNTGTNNSFNRIVSAVKLNGVNVTGTNAGNTIHWDVSQGVAPVKENGGGTINWCVVDQTRSDFGWVVEFAPNKNWQPLYVNGNRFSNMNNAFLKMQDLNQQPTVYVKDTSTLNGVEIVGSNDGARNTTLNSDLSAPLVQEFGRGVWTEKNTSRVVNSNIHHTWGAAEFGPGQLLFTRLASTGMQGCTGHWNGKQVKGCVFDDNRHTPIDIEGSVASTTYAFGPNGDGTAHTPLYKYTADSPPGLPLTDKIGAIYTPTAREQAWLNDPANAYLYTQFPIDPAHRRYAVLNIPNHNEDVIFADNIIGGNKQFIAISSSVWGFQVLRNRSLSSDVVAGTISSLGTGLLAGTPNNLGGIGLDHLLDHNQFDFDVPNPTDPSVWVANVDRITITNNRQNTDWYFARIAMKDGTLRCTHATVSGNFTAGLSQVAP